MRKPRQILSAVLAAALALGLTACGARGPEQATTSTPVHGGTLDYAIDSQPIAGGIDPMVATALAAQTVMDQAYETLLTKNDSGQVRPGLATSYKQVNSLTYDFNLRKGVRFSDGSAFDADDVLYTFKTYQNSTTSKRAYLQSVRTITKLDDYSVRFSLKHPDSTLINALSNRETFMIVSSDSYRRAPTTTRQKKSFGTGPFAVTDWKDGVSITLTRNKYYWQPGRPYLDRIVFQIIPDDSTRLAALQQGSVQAAWFLDGVVAKQAVASGWTAGKAFDTQGLPIFINPESGPLKDVRVRRAVSLALDRKALISIAMFGNGKTSYAAPAGDPASPQTSSRTPYYTHNLAEARKLLADAGQPHPTINLSYFGDTAQSQHPIYELMQQQLAQAGITLRLQSKSSSQLSPIFTSGQSFTDLVSLPWSFRADPTFYFDPFLSDVGAENHWKKSPDADKARQLLSAAKTTTDPAKKAALIEQLSNEVARQVLVLVPMAVPQHFEVWDGAQLHGYKTDPYGSRVALKDAWLSQK